MRRMLAPPKVTKRFRQLWMLIEEQSEYGRIPAIELAKFLHVDVGWLRRLIRNGDLPFAFGDSEAARASSYIDIAPLWQYMTHGYPVVLNGESDKRVLARPKKRQKTKE